MRKKRTSKYRKRYRQIVTCMQLFMIWCCLLIAGTHFNTYTNASFNDIEETTVKLPVNWGAEKDYEDEGYEDKEDKEDEEDDGDSEMERGMTPQEEQKPESDIEESDKAKDAIDDLNNESNGIEDTGPPKEESAEDKEDTDTTNEENHTDEEKEKDTAKPVDDTNKSETKNNETKIKPNKQQESENESRSEKQSDETSKKSDPE